MYTERKQYKKFSRQPKTSTKLCKVIIQLQKAHTITLEPVHLSFKGNLKTKDRPRQDSNQLSWINI